MHMRPSKLTPGSPCCEFSVQSTVNSMSTVLPCVAVAQDRSGNLGIHVAPSRLQRIQRIGLGTDRADPELWISPYPAVAHSHVTWRTADLLSLLIELTTSRPKRTITHMLRDVSARGARLQLRMHALGPIVSQPRLIHQSDDVV